MDKIPITLRGYQKLQDKLRYLKTAERPQIVEAIAAARAMGDLSENAEYESAKHKQGLIEANISAIEEKLSKAEVIDPSKICSENIMFGATVGLEDEETAAVSKFQIVGSDEADIESGLLPITSPIAKALIGKRKGDSIEVNTPKGLRRYEIMKISYL